MVELSTRNQEEESLWSSTNRYSRMQFQFEIPAAALQAAIVPHGELCPS